MKNLLSLLILTFSSCLQSSTFDTCDRDKEKLVHVDGGEKCLPKCSEDSDCKSDDVCTSSVCAPPGSILTINSPDKTDVSKEDVGVKDTSDAAVITDEEADKACADFRQKAVECTESQCGVGIDLDEILAFAIDFSGGDDCRSSVKDPELLAILETIGNDCSNSIWKEIYCSPTLSATCQTCEASTEVGKACTESDTCKGGDFGNICYREEDDSDFPDGYCLSNCSDTQKESTKGYAYENSEQCGEGNSCLVFVNEDARGAFCFQGCSAHSECRPGYMCDITYIDADGKIGRTCSPEIECTPEKCKAGKCGKEIGPQEVELSVCQFECVQGTEDLCTNSGGVCSTPDTVQKSYCVLP